MQGNDQGDVARRQGNAPVGEGDASARPKVSILVPIYNAAADLVRCLDSIAAQTLGDLEVLCINDGSTDDSLAIIERYVAADLRFVLVDKPNGGYGQGLNWGLERARGEYIAVVEPDDFIDAGMYEALYARTQVLDVPVDLVKSAFWREMPDGHTAYCSFKARPKDRQGVFTIYDDPTFLYHHPSIWSCIYRRGFLEGTAADGTCFAPIRLHEIPGAGWADNPFFIETMCRAATISYVDEAYYHYYEENPGGSSARISDVTLPFDRWHDMMDVLDTMAVHDAGVLDGQYCRGFAYVLHVRDHCNVDDPAVNAEYHLQMKRMFERMDKERVMTSGTISKYDKALYLETCGLPAERIDNRAYRRDLVREFFYSARVNGFGHACRRFRTFLDRYILHKDLAA